MNQIFCFKRYVWLLKRQWYENATGYKWGIALMALLIGAMFGLFLWISSRAMFKIPDVGYAELLFAGQAATFFTTGVLFLFVYGARFFSSLASKNRKMFYFSLPVSPLERVAVAFTFVSAFVPLLFWIIFTIFDCITVQIYNQMHDTSVQMFYKMTIENDSYNSMKAATFVTYLGYLSFVSIFALGSLIFGKKGPVLSILSIIAIFTIYSCIMKWLKVLGVSVPNTFTIGSGRDLFDFLIPLWWILMYFVMKRKEA